MVKEVYQCQGSLLVPAEYKETKGWRERLVAGKTINIFLTCCDDPDFTGGGSRFTIHGEKITDLDKLFEVMLNKVKSYLIRARSLHEITSASGRKFALSFVEDKQFGVFYQKLESALKFIGKFETCSAEMAEQPIVIMKANRIAPPKPPRTKLKPSSSSTSASLNSVANVGQTSNSGSGNREIDEEPEQDECEYDYVDMNQGNLARIRSNISCASSDRTSNNETISNEIASRTVSRDDSKMKEKQEKIDPLLLERISRVLNAKPESIPKGNKEELSGASSKQSVLPTATTAIQFGETLDRLQSQARTIAIPTVSIPEEQISNTPGNASSITSNTESSNPVQEPEEFFIGNFVFDNTPINFDLPTSEDWACHVCTLINSASIENCEACGTTKLTESKFFVYVLPASAVSWMMSTDSNETTSASRCHPSTWNCTLCSGKNVQDELLCKYCKAWICSFCTYHNSVDLRICSVCCKTKAY